MSVEREPAASALKEERKASGKGDRPSMTRNATPLAARIALVAGSVLFSLVVLEVGCRLLRAGTGALIHWPNIAREFLSTSEDGSSPCAYAYDETLGWTLPAPDCATPRFNVG